MGRILVTGANGQLGHVIRELTALNGKDEFIFADSAQLDITEGKQLESFFQKNDISYCINCAAYTKVDQAESDVKDAFLINETGVEHLAKACNSHHTTLIHISTDFVFGDARKGIPLKEQDEPNPLSVYGESKLAGEQMVSKYCKSYLIIRTSWLYSPFGKNFVKTMQALGAKMEAINVVNDQIGSPTNAADLAQAILDIIGCLQRNTVADNSKVYGIYHYSNRGEASWYDLASSTIAYSKLGAKVIPIGGDAYPTAAKRPAYSVLDTQKISHTFGVKIPYWKDSLKKIIQQML